MTSCLQRRALFGLLVLTKHAQIVCMLLLIAAERCILFSLPPGQVTVQKGRLGVKHSLQYGCVTDKQLNLHPYKCLLVMQLVENGQALSKLCERSSCKCSPTTDSAQYASRAAVDAKDLGRSRTSSCLTQPSSHPVRNTAALAAAQVKGAAVIKQDRFFPEQSEKYCKRNLK